MKDDIKELERAYGGCRKCYGKGYSTQAVADHSVNGVGAVVCVSNRYYRPYQRMIFCSCSRGRQLLKLIMLDRRAQIDQDATAFRILIDVLERQIGRLSSTRNLRAKLQHWHDYSIKATLLNQ